MKRNLEYWNSLKIYININYIYNSKYVGSGIFAISLQNYYVFAWNFDR